MIPNGDFTAAQDALKKRGGSFQKHRQLVNQVVEETNQGFLGTRVTANAEHQCVLEMYASEITLIRRTDKGSEVFCWIKLSPFSPRAQTQIVEELLNEFTDKMNRK